MGRPHKDGTPAKSSKKKTTVVTENKKKKSKQPKLSKQQKLHIQTLIGCVIIPYAVAFILHMIIKDLNYSDLMTSSIIVTLTWVYFQYGFRE